MSEQVREFIESVENGHCNIIEVAKSVLPDGTGRMQLELRRKADVPVRAESPKRSHIFHDAAGFQAYLEENRGDGRMLVLIDTEKRTAQAVLDDGAKEGFEIIRFCPPFHPVFDLIRTELLGEHEVRAFASAINRCRKYIVGIDGKPVDGPSIALLMRQITVSNQVTADCGEGNGAVNGLTLKTTVKAGQSADTRIDLPETIMLKCPIFLTAGDVEIEATVTVVPKTAERVAIRAEVPDVEVAIHDEFDKMLTDLHQAKGIQVNFGRVQHSMWDYVK